MPTPDLYLASASPRRLRLLQQLGLKVQQCPQQVDETPYPNEAPIDYVQRTAKAKADAALAQLAVDDLRPVLAADTCGELDGELLLKPQHREDGMRLLAQMSGRQHQVLTAVTVATHQRQRHCLVTSQVRFRSISPAEMAAYWQTGEPHDKAGAYAIQGIGAIFVEQISGSYSGVVGLPLCETSQLLAEFGVQVLTTETV